MKPRLAFSLLELLVSISTLAVLAAIVIVVTGRVRSNADQVICVNNMRQLGVSVILYANDNYGSYPVPSAQKPWDVALLPYLGIADSNEAISLFKCPADPRNLIVSAEAKQFARSYAFSQIRNPDTGDGVIGPGGVARKVQQLTHPSKTIMILEWFTDRNGNVRPNYQFSPSFSYVTGWMGSTYPKLGNGQCYHGDDMNFCFADGHVESFPPIEASSPVNLWQAVEP